MRKQLNVALVYNVKREIADEVLIQEGRRSGGTGDSIAAAAPVMTERATDDTYAEWDTEETILAVKSALERHHAVSLIEATEEAFPKLLQLRPDIVFNIAEGLRGPSREAQIPAMLEMLGIPYTGSDPLTLGICLDKARAKEILSYHNVPTPSFVVMHSAGEVSRCTVPLPAIVKPLHEGSSKGIYDASVVTTAKQLREQVEKVIATYHEPALVEHFLNGREFTVALLGNGDALRAFPIVEMKFDSFPPDANHIYSYEAKWVWDTLDAPLDVHQCPADVTPGLEASIIETCMRAYRVLGCRDWCRIDIRLDRREIPHIIELNPLPGILPNPDDHSCFPQAARAAGVEYDDLLNAVLDAAIARYQLA